MKNLKKTIISVTAIASLTASSFALADGFETVLPKIESDSVVSVTSNQEQYGPVTILDYVKITLERTSTDANINSDSVSILDDFRNVRDVL